MRPFTKKVLVVVLSLCLLFLMIYLKVFLSSRQEFHTAEEAKITGDYQNAIKHYERAILWYLPLGGYVHSSAEALWELAEMLESEDRKLALEAYRSLRSAFYASRSFYTPGLPWINRSDKKIAGLMAEADPYSEEDQKKSLEQRTQEALAILKKPMKPDPLWSIVVVVGLLGWVSGVLLFILKAFRGGTQVMLKQGFLWGTVVVFFYALWIVGMMRA